MEVRKSGRSWFLKCLATALVGLTLIPLIAQPAEAARFRGRGVGRGWGGYRAYRTPYRAYNRAYPRYGYGSGAGYGGALPRYYNSNYYGGGLPYGYGPGGYSAPMNSGLGYYNYTPPMF